MIPLSPERGKRRLTLLITPGGAIPLAFLWKRKPTNLQAGAKGKRAPGRLPLMLENSLQVEHSPLVCFLELDFQHWISVVQEHGRGFIVLLVVVFTSQFQII